jgi:AraC family transcriptional regulator, transcriptional activator of pobA
MQPIHSLEDFYRNKLNLVPDNLKKDIGHFNVFRMEDFIGKPGKQAPYSRKDYYKISLIIGKNLYFYADKTIEIKQAAISFAHPMIPYHWERLDDQQSGCFCVFTEAFLDQVPGLREYPVFKPGLPPLFELDMAEVDVFRQIFDQMFVEINSEYAYKYDLLRTLVLQLVHKAMQLKPHEAAPQQGHNANNRIAALFLELLERQFPIESPLQGMKLRMPVDFATYLSVHINHLNRALKHVTGKTTTQLIAERILQEARILLKQTDWNISQIGYCLGFAEPSHFISFFRRSMHLTPGAFRG